MPGRLYADRDPSAFLVFTHNGLICLQYLEIEVKNPRTHIENEKAQYTDYEIELKVRYDSILLLGRVNFTGQFSPFTSDQRARVSCVPVFISSFTSQDFGRQ